MFFFQYGNVSKRTEEMADSVDPKLQDQSDLGQHLFVQTYLSYI